MASQINKADTAKADLPLVPWQGKRGSLFSVFRLEDTHNKTPEDGHDPMVPHRIGFHALFLVTDGSFEHWMDFETRRFEKNDLVYISPDQVHHFVKHPNPKNAWVLIFRPESLPQDLLGKITNQRPSWSVVSYIWPELTKLSDSEASLLDEQLTLIKRFKSDPALSNSAAAKHHVSGVVTSAFEFATKVNEDEITWEGNERFFQFVHLIEDNFRIRRDVKWYATKLQCSERTLNRTCQQTTGSSAKTFLTQRVIVEAKRVLTYGLEPVNLVAESLGFGETTNFVRLFKGEVGMTPMAFRALHRGEVASGK